MQTITTKFIPPTNHRATRHKASCTAGSLTLEQDDRLNPEQNHVRVALALIHKLGWDSDGREWYYGSDQHGDYTFVCARPDTKATPEAAGAERLAAHRAQLAATK